MFQPRFLLVVAGFGLAFLCPDRCPAQQDAAASNESRMREALRTTMQQLNDAQNQVATLQAAQTQSDKDKADLQAKLDALTAQLKTVTDQSAADRDAAAKSEADLNAQLAVQTKQVALLNTALGQWKGAYTQMAALAKTTELQREKLVGEKLLLERLVDDRELKNAELYNLGNEILTRYEKFSLGEALSAKEPFVGTSRVRLQNLVQDYKDKLLDARLSPGSAPTTPPPVAAKRAEVRTAQNAPVLEKASP